MEEYRSVVNSGFLYLAVGLVLLFVVIMCLVFMVKSYKAGIRIGMEKSVLRKTIISSATFTVLPSISILLGVLALSGSLGVPFSWLRLSVIGALQYELNVAEISATSLGLSGLHVGEMTVPAFTTIGLVMTVGILGSIFCCIFFLKKYLKKFSRKTDQPKAVSAESETKPKKRGFGDYATTAMFIGLCGAYIGSYVGQVTAYQQYTPLFTAAVSAVVMLVFEYFTNRKQVKWLDNFSVATSMLVGMVAAVFFQQII